MLLRTDVLFIEAVGRAPQKVGPSSVDSITDRMDGVWYPSMGSCAQHPTLKWRGGGPAYPKNPSYLNGVVYFDPFACCDSTYSLLSSYDFAEPLVQQCSLDWLVPQPGFARTAATRGNESIAAHERSDVEWLSKAAFLELAAVRAFPQQQLRKVCMALRKSHLSLPLEQQAVRSVLLQALYHLGELSEITPTRLEWKHDQSEGDGWLMLQRELELLSNRLIARPKDYLQLKFASEVAAYASQWSEGCRVVARRLCNTAFAWAQEIGRSIDESSSARDHMSLTFDRRKQTIYYLCSLIGQAYGALTHNDVRNILVSRIKSEHFRAMDDYVESAESNYIKSMVLSADAIMIYRANAILEVVRKNPSLITKAVQEILRSAPDDLEWHPLEVASMCFDAAGRDGHLYSVNVTSGTLLFDGLLLKKLPDDIRSNAIFQRLFGNSVFEVQVVHGVAFYTVRPIEGCYYRFELSCDNKLLVEEVPTSTDGASAFAEDDKLRFVDMDDSHGNLPDRLQQLYSHWIDHKGICMVLRSHWYLDRKVRYLMLRNDTAGEPEWTCCRIPKHLEASCPEWQQLIPQQHNFDQLRILSHDSSAVKRILCSFELEKYIHVYKTPSDEIKLHLPRFDLEFCSDGTVANTRCLTFSGHLCGAQNLSTSGWLATLQQYLMLTDNCPIRESIRVLIPIGKIKYGPNGTNGVQIKNAHASDHVMSYYVYDVHQRFHHLHATNVEARLYLAALHAASSSLLSLTFSNNTEFEVAISLLRRSWVNRPLTAKEMANLKQVVEFAIGCPTLKLLCCELYYSSREFAFLHNKPDLECDGFDAAGASTEYHLRKNHRNFNFELSTEEQERLSCGMPAQFPIPDWLRLQSYRRCETAARDFVESVDGNKMVQFTEESSVCPSKRKTFPLNTSLAYTQSSAGKGLIGLLQDSWDVHCSISTYIVRDRGDSHVSLTNWLKDCRRETSVFRIELEAHLLSELGHIEPLRAFADDRWRAEFLLSRVVNDVPTPSVYDLCKLALKPSLLYSLNPFFDEGSWKAVRADLILWMKLCVLEDKCIRLLKLHVEGGGARSNEARIVQELRSPRIWSAEKHPEWLLFEMEGGIQIRPLQYVFAEYLWHNPSAITQLNMGEGKTRVVLPLLMMRWASSNKQEIFRLHFLTQLLEEAYAYLHLNLTASTHEMKLVLLPFHRQVELTPARAYLVKRCLQQRCLHGRGCLLIAAEHRLSFDLKWYEASLYGAQEGTSQLCNVLESIYHLPFWDVLDESDELLKYKYQLIYSTGLKLDLPAAEIRYAVPAAIFDVIQRSPTVRAILNRANVSICSEHDADSKEFQRVRLIPGDALDNANDDLRNSIIDAIIEDPPYEFGWLRQKKFKCLHEAIRRFVSQPSFTMDSFEQAMKDEQQQQQQQQRRKSLIPRQSRSMAVLLTLRGYLAHGLLWHILQKRHRVNYGVSTTHYSGKKMALPFKAHDTPSERSQFGHPDTEIALSYLSYYYDGVSMDQVRDSFRTLLKMNPNAQGVVYRRWLALSHSDLKSAGLDELVDSVDKIDLSNGRQLRILFDHFRSNRQLITFWLTNCVFPNETRQFEKKLMASAWHLASNNRDRIVGMSGTNDSALIYPLQVKQHIIPGEHAKELHATNGKMLNVLSNDEVKYIPTDISGARSVSDVVLEQFLAMEADVLIDAGAVCSDYSNSEVASRFAAARQKKPVVYYDAEMKDWVVRDGGGQKWSLQSSPIKERDCLVFIDEVRCRGTDLKLRPGAVGLLTLGLGITKDKLMQAAARMRMLAMGQQKVHLIGTPDVTASIQAANGSEHVSSLSITAQHVLQWVMLNTVKYVQDGLKEWDYQGQYFCATDRQPHLAHINDMQTLEQLYGHASHKQSVRAIHEVTSNRFSALKSSMTSKHEQLRNQLRGHIDSYGFDCEVAVAMADEEAEKESEREKEVELEVEKEVRANKPRAEVDWDPALLLNCSSVLKHTDAAGVPLFALHDFLHSSTSARLNLRAIQWQAIVNCYCTKNFAFALENEEKQLENYLRPVDAMLYFPASNEVVLLSEREADRVLTYMWQHSPQPFNAVFLNLTYLHAALSDRSTTEAECKIMGLRGVAHYADGEHFPPRVGSEQYRQLAATCAALELFNGGVMFDSEEMKDALRQLLGDVHAQQVAMSFCSVRGLRFLFPRSDFEAICQDHIEQSAHNSV